MKLSKDYIALRARFFCQFVLKIRVYLCFVLSKNNRCISRATGWLSILHRISVNEVNVMKSMNGINLPLESLFSIVSSRASVSEVAGCNRRQHPHFAVAPQGSGRTAWVLAEAAKTGYPAAVTSSRDFGLVE